MRSTSTRLVLGIALAVIASLCSPLVPSSLALPAERHYELVSPEYKGGYGATHIEAVAQNGDSVAYYSPGVFAGSPAGVSGSLNTLLYVACRGQQGWSTEPVAPPDSLVPLVLAQDDMSPTTGSIIAVSKPGPNYVHTGLLGSREEILLHPRGSSTTCVPDTAGSWERVGPVLESENGENPEYGYDGGSANFCHVVIANGGGEGGLVGVPLSSGTKDQLYDLVRGCDGELAGVKMIGLNNKEEPIGPKCAVSLNGSTFGFEGTSSSNAVAHGGHIIFFRECVGQDENHKQLFARLDGQRTIEISKPIENCTEVPCTSALSRAKGKFRDASEDGSLVYMLSEAPLSNETGDTSENLYLASLGCEPSEPSCELAKWTVTKLVKVTRVPAPGGKGEALGVVRVAPDGRRAYFVARGDLLTSVEETALRSEGKPVPRSGAANLYVYETSGGAEKITFIADLCTGGERSGSFQDIDCPVAAGATDSSLWGDAAEEAQTAGSDGRYLVFSSYARLTADDTDSARDVYRYDAVTGALTRVSLGEKGYHSNGNGESAPGTANANATLAYFGEAPNFIYEMRTRAISEDGSRIVFTSAEPLSPAAINGLPNAYEWHEGEVSIVSTGAAETPVEDVVISPEGNDIFFDTTEGILPQDTDGAPDVYDARIGPGFPPVAAQREQCASDGCQGPLTPPAPLFVPGSVSQAPGGNFPAPVATHARPKQRKQRAAAKGHRRRGTHRAGRRGKGKRR